MTPGGGTRTRHRDGTRRGIAVRGAGGKGGFALIAALWVVVAAAFLVTGLSLTARTQRLAAANAREGLQARAAARAGLAHALARLDRAARERGPLGRGFGRMPGEAWRLVEAASADSLAVGPRGRASVRLHDLGARLPLNRVDAPALRRFFSALGASFGEARVAAQSIMDWRDADGLHRPEGAEWDDYYRYRDPPVRPRNGPFLSVWELRRVRGVDDRLFRRAAPHLTVDTDGPVNLNAAPEPVLRALPGLTDEAVALILRRRRFDDPLGSLSQLEGQLSAGSAAVLRRHFDRLARRMSFEARTLMVSAVGRLEGSPATARLEALVVRDGQRAQVVWRRER